MNVSLAANWSTGFDVGLWPYPVVRPLPMSGGSTADTRPSRPGDRSTLSSGRSVELLQCRRPTLSRRPRRSNPVMEID